MKELGETHALTPMKTKFAKGRRARPLMTHAADTENRTPQHAVKPTKDIKTGFRSIFRSKQEEENQPISPVVESPIIRPAALTTSTHSLLGSPYASESLLGKTESSSLLAKSSEKCQTSSAKPQKRRKTLTKSSKPAPVVACDVLPLYRVYAQNTKYARLVSSTLAADTIIRSSNRKKDNGIIKGIAQSTLEEGKCEASTKDKKTGKKKKHKRNLTGSISSAQWTESIYVLISPGTLLQYAGEGPLDREPEKTLHLCKDSVVFASDAIPGKHWVLQVSEVMDPKGKLAADSRSLSLLSRLKRGGAQDSMKTNSFLLILENAEDMESWISALRRTIESLGGKKHVSETGTADDNELTKSWSSPKVMSLTSDSENSISGQLKDGVIKAAAPASRPLSTMSPSINAPSIDTPSISTATSREDVLLENLRDNSPHRLSHMSLSQQTIGTSRGSTPDHSPTSDKFLRMEGYSSGHLRPNARAVNERRRSLQAMENSIPPTPTKALRPHSTLVRGPHTFHNFCPSQNLDIPNPSHSLASNFSTFSRSTRIPRDDASDYRLKTFSARKRSPSALSLPRPLTPVQDSHSPSSPSYAFASRLDSLSAVRKQRYDLTLNRDRPLTASAATPPKPRPEYPWKRFSSQAAIECYDSKKFDPFRNLLPSRSPPPPPQNLPTPSTHVGFLGPAAASTALVYSRISQQQQRRPVSMQVRTSSTPASLPVSRYSISLEPVISPSSPTKRNISLASASLVTGGRPLYQPGNSQPTSKQVNNRKSMPQLVMSGPPKNPPPVCALPPLPSESQI